MYEDLCKVLRERLCEIQQIFDKAWNENKTATPQNSLSRLCTTLLPNMLQDGEVAADAIESLKTENERLTAENAELREAQRWIACKEKLPDDIGSYMVYYHEWSNGDFLPKYDDCRIRVMRFLNNGKWHMPVCTDKRCEADTNREVTHWMPLPDPPQKEETL